jgi:hypothetical protein
MMHRQAPNLPRGLNAQTSLMNISWLLVVQAHGHYQLTCQVAFRARAVTGLHGFIGFDFQICRAGDPDREF